jgi:hypothetical protein
MQKQNGNELGGSLVVGGDEKFSEAWKILWLTKKHSHRILTI